MIMIKKILFPLIILFITLFTAVTASAATVITEGVSILNPRQNIRGSGYEWDNINDVLTISNLNIQTDDDYGLKIRDNSTVIIKGNNYIKASEAAIYIGGNVIFKGTGTLTLYGGKFGILCNSENTVKKFSITGGNYDITSGSDAVYSAGQIIELSGGKINLSSKNGYAINARDLSTSAGVKIQADSSLFASHSMLLQATDFKIESGSPAFICDSSLKLESMKLKVGESLSSLSVASEYSGEKAVDSVSTLSSRIPSILFGSKYSVAADISILVSSLAVIAASIAVPKLIKKKKIEKIASQNSDNRKKK